MLALATSPNPHEAAVAAAHAQTLIESHRLERWLAAEDEVREDPDPIEDARDAPLETAKRLRKWKVVLATTLAQANGCVAYTLAGDPKSSIVLVGRSRDREMVRELWAWLVKQIEWLSATNGEGQDRRWHDAFRIGVVSAVSERLKEAVQSVHSELDSSALERVDPARVAHREALERFVSERLSLGRGRNVRVDAEAWEQGHAASGKLKLP